jgi:membrane-associated phospholipid phosphatase
LSLEGLRRLDARGTDWLRALPKGAGVRAVLSVVAHSGDSLVLVPLLGVLWWLEGFSGRAIAVPLAAAYLLSVVLTTLVKYVVRRRRPDGDWGALYRKTDPHSFPSGHASRTAALSVVVLARGLVLPGAQPWLLHGAQPWLLHGAPPGLLPAVLLACWSLLVGFARVTLGVHYLLDVVVGYLLGLAIGAAVALWFLNGLPL